MRGGAVRAVIAGAVVALMALACRSETDHRTSTPTPLPAPTPTVVQGPVGTTGPAVWVAPISGGRVLRIDPASNQLAGSVRLDGSVWSLAPADDALWIGGDRLLRVDRATSEVTTVSDLAGAYPLDIAVGDDAIWVVVSPTWSLASMQDAPRTGRLLSVDPQTLAVTAEIALDSSHPSGVAIGSEAIWVTEAEITPGAPTDFRVARVDPATNRITATIPLPAIPRDLATDAGTVWVATWSTVAGESLLRIDPATNRAAAGSAQDGAIGSLATVGGEVWTTTCDIDTLTVRSTRGEPLFAVRPAGRCFDVAFGASAIWVTSSTGDEGWLERVDAASHQVVATIPIGEAAWVAATD